MAPFLRSKYVRMMHIQNTGRILPYYRTSGRYGSVSSLKICSHDARTKYGQDTAVLSYVRSVWLRFFAQNMFA